MKTQRDARPLTQPIASHRSWPSAYRAFLYNRHESFVLKIAPLALLVGSPEIIASNIVPVLGEVVDIGGLTLTVVVVVRTYRAVRRYR